MGCGGSKEEGGASDAGSPPAKQAQKKQATQAELDAAAGEIQKAALGFKQRSEEAKQKEMDAAAADIQKSAAAYLQQKKEKDAAAKPGEGFDLRVPLGQAVDAVVQFSHRLLGGGDQPASEAKPETVKEEEADLAAAADAMGKAAEAEHRKSEVEKDKAAAIIQKSAKRKAKKK
jgi:hypothetical protein